MRSRSLPCTPRPLTRAVRAAVIALPLSILAAPPASAAETDARRYEIPAGPLSSALSRFAGDAGVLLSVDGNLVQGLNSSGLRGEYAVDQGLPYSRLPAPMASSAADCRVMGSDIRI